MDIYQKLRQNMLFMDLSNTDLDNLLKISKKVIIQKDTYFIHEGDSADRFYFVLSGSIAITKAHDEHYKRQHVIAEVEAGDTVGEIALLDNQPRIASARAVTDLELLSFQFDEFRALVESSSTFSKIYQHIIDSVGHRIRRANAIVVSALEKQINEYKMRVGLGLFMINTIVAICLFSFFLTWLSSKENNSIASTVVSLPLTIMFVILFISIMKGSQLPLKTFGLTMENWREALTESALFTCILCLIIQFVKWILVHTTHKYMGQPVFSPYLTISLDQSSRGWSYKSVWLTILLLYTLVISPLQELICRGGLQGPLEVFLTGKHVVLKAIVVSNILFSTVHLFLGVETAVMVFFAGLYFGWLYSRHHNLLSVTFAHALLGTWATMVVGF